MGMGVNIIILHVCPVPISVSCCNVSTYCCTIDVDRACAVIYCRYGLSGSSKHCHFDWVTSIFRNSTLSTTATGIAYHTQQKWDGYSNLAKVISVAAE